jgi:hypothetical protein
MTLSIEFTYIFSYHSKIDIVQCSLWYVSLYSSPNPMTSALWIVSVMILAKTKSYKRISVYLNTIFFVVNNLISRQKMILRSRMP